MKKKINYKILDLVQHYNFDMGHVSVQGRLKQNKKFKIRNLWT